MPFGGNVLRAVLESTADEISLTELYARCSEAFVSLGGAHSAEFAELNEDGTHAKPLAPGSALEAALSSSAPVVRDGTPARVALPLRFGHRILGAFEIVCDAAPAEEQLDTLAACSLAIAARIDRDAALRRSQALEELALRDGLTAIANRRAFDAALARTWSMAQRNATQISLLMLDVDYFKFFNDTYGHQAGDDCLVRVAGALARTVLRPSDLAARYGGEEFVVLLPGTDAAGAIALGERIREAIEALQLEHAASSLNRVSVSIGAATHVPQSHDRAEDLMRAADDALYRAKLAGRNRVCGLNYTSVAESATPVRTQKRDHLPFRITTMIGREEELDHVIDSIDEHRLTTITGVGGSGKTRLAVEVAWRIADRFTGGAHFIDLAPLRDPLTIAPAIATVLGLADVGTDADGRALAHAIGDRKILVLLDNCEHLTAAVASIVAMLLRHAPNVQVLATSREILGVPGEKAYNLPTLNEGDAIALFADRAGATAHDFVLDETSAKKIATICSSMSGIALAISLAAAQIETMSLDEIVEQARRSQGREAMESALRWSYELLGDDERRLFRRLAAFRGSFSLEATIDVCAEDVPPDAAFETLARLVRKSMVASTADGRYHLLEPLRVFASEQLAAAGESARLAQRHAAFFARIAARERMRERVMNRAAWSRRVGADIDNFRRAIAWTVSQGHDVALGARIAGDIATVWELYGIAEGMRVVEEALSKEEGAPYVWLAMSWMLDYLGATPRRQIEGAERAMALFKQRNDPRELFDGYVRRAQCYSNLRMHAEARADLARAGELAAQLGDEAYAIHVARASARAALMREDWNEAGRLYRDLVAHYRHQHDAHLAAVLLKSLAEIEFARGEIERAIECANEPETRSVDAGQRIVIDTNLTAYLVAAGRFADAYVLGRTVIARSWEQQIRLARILTIQHLALAFAMEGDVARATRLRGFVDARLAELEFQREFTERYTYDRLVDIIERRLAHDTRKDLEARGSSLTDEQAAAEAVTV